MSKKTSRILSIGLLVSSMVVMGLEIWSPSFLRTSQTESPESLVENITELENKILDLEEENRSISQELDRLTEGYSNRLTLSDVEETDEENDESDADEESVSTSGDEEAEVEENIQEFTLTVKEGEPSSVLAEQLEYLGVIENRHDFNEFLESNDLAKKVRPGNYVVTSDMTTDELAQAVLR